MSKDMKANDLDDLQQSPSRSGEVLGGNVQHDAVFGEITEEGPQYRDVGWLATAALMIKTQIGLGVLSIPTVLDTFGLIPGNIVLVLVASVTTWSDHMVGVFKINHPAVYGIDDVGQKFFGPIGRELFGAAYCLYFAFCAGSATLGTSIAFNTLSDHGTCTTVFVAVAAIISYLFSSIRTLSRIGWLAWVGTMSVITSIFLVTIAVTLQDHPSSVKLAPGQAWKSDYKLVNTPSFTDGISAISTLIFAYAGTPGFFNIVAEMRTPKNYHRSLMACQGIITAVYIIIGTIMYYYCGSYISSPALGSAGPLIKKVGYGISLPGLLVSGIVLAHMPAKHVFVRLLRGTEHLTSNSFKHWATWLGCTGTVALIAYLIASAVPEFSSLISLIGAFLGTFLTFQPYAGMWLYDNWHRKDLGIWWYGGVCWSVLIIGVGTFLQISGTYAAVVNIIAAHKEPGGSAVWSCVDNSNS